MPWKLGGEAQTNRTYSCDDNNRRNESRSDELKAYIKAGQNELKADMKIDQDELEVQEGIKAGQEMLFGEKHWKCHRHCQKTTKILKMVV